MKKIFFLVLTLFLITLVSAQLGYNNPNLPRINAPTRTTTTTSLGNVTSVTSSTNCITVNPTTGDVILTFNTSCAPSFNGGNFFFANFTGSFNSNLSAVLPLTNRTISNIANITGFFFNYNQTIAGNPFNQILNTTSNVTFDYVTTTGNVTSNKWFNGLFNWTTTSHFTFNGALLSLSSTVTQWLYNQTTAVFTMPTLNLTIEGRGLAVGFNSTFNATYNRMLNTTCDSGYFVVQVNSSGSVICGTTDPLPPDPWAYNQTTAVFNNPILNQTIDKRLFNHTQFSVSEGQLTRALNQSYQNNRGRPIMVYGSIKFVYDDLPDEPSYAIIYVSNGTASVPRQRIGTIDIINFVGVLIDYFEEGHAFSFVVPSGSFYSINTTSANSAYSTLEYWNEVDL